MDVFTFKEAAVECHSMTITLSALAARKHPPDPPINAVVLNKTNSSITIQWSPPDSDRPVPIKCYMVERRKVGTQTWQRCNAGETLVSTEITICNFTEESSFQFRISAMNDFGQSPHLEVPGSFYLGKADVPLKSVPFCCCCIHSFLMCGLLVASRALCRDNERPDEQHCKRWRGVLCHHRVVFCLFWFLVH